MTGMQAYLQIQQELYKEFPGYQIVRKRDSKLMKAIDVLLRVITFNQMKLYLTDFITTLGVVVYVPTMWEDMNEADRAIVLRHERVHMRQRVRHGKLWFSVLYTLLPLPCLLAYYRTKFEKEAYEETLRATLELYPNCKLQTSEARDEFVSYFTTSYYFWMWPFKKSIGAWYDATVARILSEKGSS